MNRPLIVGSFAFLTFMGWNAWTSPSVSVASEQTKFVQASTLKLRAEPRKDAKLRGRLTINSPLVVFDEKGHFVKVRAQNGAGGWVGKDFLSSERLTVAAARAHARHSDSPTERLMWLQRATAMEPKNLELLAELKGAYTRLGKYKAAQIVSDLIRALKRVQGKGRLVAMNGKVLQWSEILYDDTLRRNEAIEREKWSEFDFARAEIWVLPEQGPAKRAAIQRAARGSWNECAGTQGLSVVVDTEGIIAYDGPPPGSWKATRKTWGSTKIDLLTERIKKLHCTSSKTCDVGVVTQTGYGAFVRVNQVTESSVQDTSTIMIRTLDLRIVRDDPNGALKTVAESSTEAFHSEVPMPTVMRDIVGDEAPEIFLRGNCESEVLNLRGNSLFLSHNMCCGC